MRAELSGKPLRFSEETLNDPNLEARERQLYQSRLRNRDETVLNLQQSIRLVEQKLKMTEPLVARSAASAVEVIRLRRQISEIRGKIDEARNLYAVRACGEQVKNNADLEAQLEVVNGKADQLRRATLTSPVRGIVKDI